ncbi:MAG TPA: TolC family protein [Burkholderiales bacterium]|nr:TolC family protein [Burkholderiales bacterium]
MNSRLVLAMAISIACLRPAHAWINAPDLPPAPAVKKALLDHPSVREAALQLPLEQANRRRLAAGPYEYNVNVAGQRRKVNEPPDQFNEWAVGVDRTLRLPGKAKLDATLGDQGLVRAQLAYGNAIQSTARTLLKAWFGWLREKAQAGEWQTQLAVLREQLRVTALRAKKGDAAKLDVGLMEAAVAQADFALKQAQARERVAANEVAVQFPPIPLSEQAPRPVPEPLAQGLDYWRERVQQGSYELQLARAESERLRLTGARAAAERTPDPTVGLRYGSERGGDERIVTLNLSIPIPSAARSAAASAARTEWQMAAQREANVLQRLNTEAANQYVQAQGAYDSWQSMRVAADRMQSNADLTARAYQLGERGMLDVLVARRQLVEARLAARLAEIDAAEARYRLLLEANELWPMPAQ